MIKPQAVAYSIILILFAGCQKNAEIPAANTLLNDWSLIKFTSNQYYSGSNHENYLFGVPGDYLDFRGDNKLYSQISGYSDTTTFQLVNNNLIILNGFDTLQVRSISATNLILYSKAIINRNSFYEKTYYLKKRLLFGE